MAAPAHGGASGMTVLSIDFETASTLDLRKTGVYPYARHPETRVLCMAYAWDDKEPEVWRYDQPFPQDVLDHVLAQKDVRAWNAGFEYQIWNNTLLRQIFGRNEQQIVTYKMFLTQLHDTMADAAYYGLPLSLDQAAEAAHTGHKKDKEGHALMMRMNKPRSKDKQGNPTAWWHEDDPEKFARLCTYCAQDVRVERDVKRAIGQDLPASERAMWLLDQRINGRGVALDVPLIERMQDVANDAKADINAALNTYTCGAVKSVGSNKAMLEYVNSKGFQTDNLRADTVANEIDRIDRVAAPSRDELDVIQVLELRAAGSKTSVAKLPSMLACSALDEQLIQCVRGMLQYYGAFRTGRWAGRLIQPQNMPRPSLKEDVIRRAIDAIMAGADAATLELLFGVPAMEIISSLLRSVLVARKGRKLVVFDFSQIEARVLPWLADEQKTLEVFRRGEDIYKHGAADVFSKPADQIDGDERQIGKVATLALGFGGGKGAFQTMAQNYGVTVTDKRAEEIKVAWRAGNPKVVQLWWDLDAAFKAACADTTGTFIQQVGQWLRVGRWGAHVVIVLPSGRGLFYRDAKLEANPDDPSKLDATYMGLNQYTRKWERLRTYGGKLAENVTQATARDCMAHVMLEADKQGIQTLLTVHDELITEADARLSGWQADKLEQLMSTPPTWAPGLPVAGDGWIGDRYRK